MTMCRLCVTICLVWLSPYIQGQQHSQRLLFVGNSYTFVNDLPNMYRTVAQARINGLTVQVDSDTAGERMLGQAANAASCKAKVEAGNYDVLVLQDQSCLGGVPNSLQFEQRRQSCAALSHYFGEKAALLGKTVVLYETWGRKNGAPTMCGPAIADRLFPTFGAMQSKLSSGYEEYKVCLEKAMPPESYQGKVLIARAGQARASVKLEDASLFSQLYEQDGSHPSVLGQYLTANVLVSTIWQSTQVGDPPVVPGVAPQQASLLGAVAAKTIESSLAKSIPNGKWEAKFDALHPSTWYVQGSTLRNANCPTPVAASTQWQLVENAYCFPHGATWTASETGLGKDMCKTKCDRINTCNAVTYDASDGKCYMWSLPDNLHNCDSNVNGWSYWKAPASTAPAVAKDVGANCANALSVDGYFMDQQGNPTSTSLSAVIGDTVFWSDGDVWTRTSKQSQPGTAQQSQTAPAQQPHWFKPGTPTVTQTFGQPPPGQAAPALSIQSPQGQAPVSAGQSLFT